jgi:hypothetical protein
VTYDLSPGAVKVTLWDLEGLVVFVLRQATTSCARLPNIGYGCLVRYIHEPHREEGDHVHSSPQRVKASSK